MLPFTTSMITTYISQKHNNFNFAKYKIDSILSKPLYERLGEDIKVLKKKGFIRNF